MAKIKMFAETECYEGVMKWKVLEDWKRAQLFWRAAGNFYQNVKGTYPLPHHFNYLPGLSTSSPSYVYKNLLQHHM